MVVQRQRIEEAPDGLCVVGRWKGLHESEKSVKSIANIYKYVQEVFKKWLQRKKTPATWVDKARRI